MSQRLPQPFIDELLSRTDIVEIVSSRVKLKKTSGDYTGLCPFHNEKTPSFSVSAPKQFYYCFGCHASGNVITFLMKFDNVDFLEAVRILATKLGLDIPNEKEYESNKDKNKKFYSLMNKAKDFYKKQLKNSKTATSYIKERGISDQIIDEFSIGYASFNNDLSNLTSKENESFMVSLGLISNKYNKTYDVFKNRIIFPIFNEKGDTIGLGGRIIKGDKAPKYLNTKESVIFHKGNELYGLYQAKRKNKKLARILVTEGYMDVISLAEHGISYAVATLGTAINARHIQKLLRYTNDIVFCFDADFAGEKAALKALENSLSLMHDGVNISFLFLPDKEDPDSQIKKEGKDKFEERLKNTTPLSEFFIKQITQDSKKSEIKTIDVKTKVAQKARFLLNKLPNGIFKELLEKKISQIIDLDVKSYIAYEKSDTSKQDSKTLCHPLVASALRLIMSEPSLEKYVDIKQLSNINVLGTDILSRVVFLAHNNPNVKMANILEYFSDPNVLKMLAKLSSKPIIVTDLKSEFLDTIKRLYKLDEAKTIQKFLLQFREGKISEENKSVLQTLIMNYKKQVL